MNAQQLYKKFNSRRKQFLKEMDQSPSNTSINKLKSAILNTDLCFEMLVELTNHLHKITEFAKKGQDDKLPDRKQYDDFLKIIN